MNSLLVISEEFFIANLCPIDLWLFFSCYFFIPFDHHISLHLPSPIIQFFPNDLTLLVHPVVGQFIHISHIALRRQAFAGPSIKIDCLDLGNVAANKICGYVHALINFGQIQLSGRFVLRPLTLKEFPAPCQVFLGFIVNFAISRCIRVVIFLIKLLGVVLEFYDNQNIYHY